MTPSDPSDPLQPGLHLSRQYQHHKHSTRLHWLITQDFDRLSIANPRRRDKIHRSERITTTKVRQTADILPALPRETSPFSPHVFFQRLSHADLMYSPFDGTFERFPAATKDSVSRLCYVQQCRREHRSGVGKQASHEQHNGRLTLSTSLAPGRVDSMKSKETMFAAQRSPWIK